MAKDFQIAFPCPHIIGEERTQLASDRRTLRTTKPISGAGLLEVVVNDKHTVSPSMGLQSSAILTSGKAEPYLVVAGSTSLTIRTQARTLTLTLPTGYANSERIVSLINAAVFSVNERPYLVASTVNGVLTLQENLATGPESWIRVSGSAVLGLNFTDQVGAMGQTILPAWNIYSRAIEAEEGVIENGYFIQFDRPVRTNPYFSITYAVFGNQCLRCRGTEVENDFRFDADGAARLVRDENLLYQSCLKILLTELKSNIYAPWYGTDLMSQIGSKVGSGSDLSIQQSIRRALTDLQSLQATQSKYQKITPRERLYSVDNIAVRQSPNDPTMFLADVSIRNFAFEPIHISIVYTAPGAFALAGTNGLSLGNF